MSSTKFKRYTPGTAVYSRRRSDEEWAEHRDLLTRLHAQHYTRRQMLRQLKDHGFAVSPGQLLAQMKKWDLMVYDKPTAIPNTVSDSSTFPSAVEYIESISNPSPQPLQLSQIDRETTQDIEDVDAGFMGGLRLTNPAQDELLDPIPQSEPLATPPADPDADEVIPAAPPPYSPSPTYLSHVPSNETTSNNASDEQLDLQNAQYGGWNLSSASSILQQLSGICEPWCTTFPMSCCCNTLLFCDDSFKKSPHLYRIITQQSSPTSLQYVWAVLSLAIIDRRKSSGIDIQTTLRSLIEVYLDICTNVEIKNRQANLILHHLLDVWVHLSYDNDESPMSAEVQASWLRRNNILIRRIFRMKPKTHLQMFEDDKVTGWEAASERDVNTIVGFAARKPSLFPLLNWSGSMFGAFDNWLTVSEQHDADALLTTAEALAKYMHQRWYHTRLSAQPQLMSICDLPTIFNVLGLMVALELDEYARTLIQNDGNASDSDVWPEELKNFLQTTITTLSLNSEYAEKFRKTYWLAKVALVGHVGKKPHYGPCKAADKWRTLARDIHDWDEERSWIERRLFAGQSKWPQPEDLIDTDGASIRSSGSLNSFRHFQALALQLKLGTGTPCSRSLRSKSTKSKMSWESHLSWQLETMLGIEEDNRGGNNTTAEVSESTVDPVRKLQVRNISPDSPCDDRTTP